MSYYEPEPSDPFNTIMAVILMGALALAIVGSCLGCATTQCPPCVPEIETVQINVPVPSCEPPPELPGVEYPEWPRLPQNATEEQIKAFYAAAVATQKAREKICQEYVKSLEEILDGYRE